MDSVDFATAWTFFSRNEWQWLFGKWGTDPGPLLRLLALSLPFRGNSSIEITVNPENEASLYDHDLDSADLQLHAVCLRIREGVHAPFFLTSHSSATRHQWLNLFSTRHECFTSDVGLTRTRLVSCILLTSLIASALFEYLVPARMSRIFAKTVERSSRHSFFWGGGGGAGYAGRAACRFLLSLSSNCYAKNDSFPMAMTT